ncbi:MAG: ABC transporter permease [Candidatus Sulfotelmatobacter sp.]
MKKGIVVRESLAVGKIGSPTTNDQRPTTIFNMHNLRYAFRSLKNAPGLSLIVILALALGIGATTAVFSLVEGILLRPLPFRDPSRLVLIGDRLGEGHGTTVTAREINTYATATNAFASQGGYITAGFELSGGATPEEINAARFTASVFPTLGVQPILGRVFTPQEENARQPLAVISYALWQTRFHGDPNILGSALSLDRKPYTIIGVMPRSFQFPLEDGRLEQAQLWVPLSLTPEELSDQYAGFFAYRIVARLKDGVTLSQAGDDANRVSQQVMRNMPAGQTQIHIRGQVIPLLEYGVGEVRPLLRTLFLCVSVVLLIACVNVAGLLLVRAIRRRAEYAIRLALGAGSRAVVRESLFEGLLLGAAGGILGMGFAALIVRAALQLLPESMPRIDSISLDGAVVSFGLLLALATGALCSFAPAFAALKVNLTESLKENARTGSTPHARLRSALVVSEIAIALVLVTTSAAFVRSFQKMCAVDPGFRPDHVLSALYQLPLQQYPTTATSDSFNLAVLDRLASKPGVTAVGVTTSLPASDISVKSGYTFEGQTENTWKLKFAAFGTIYGDYFRTMDIRLLEGRYFNQDDRANAPLVVIVNQTMAKNCWPGESAIGKRLHVGGPKKKSPWMTIIGVVANTRIGSRDEPSGEQWYTPAQQPASLYDTGFDGKLTDSAGGYITVRSALPPEQMVRTLRASVAQVDPLLALQQVQSMTEAISSVETPRRFNTGLITVFAVGALLLAISGIYAVIAFSVSQRTQEIAIRMALGAQRQNVARLVLISGAKLAVLGCFLGLLGSVAASQIVGSFLFEVSATDPWIYAASALLMIAMALAASAIPAIRAASADPMQALRST